MVCALYLSVTYALTSRSIRRSGTTAINAGSLTLRIGKKQLHPPCLAYAGDQRPIGMKYSAAGEHTQVVGLSLYRCGVLSSRTSIILVVKRGA